MALQLHAHEEAHRHLALPPPPSEPPCAKRGAETHRPKSTLGPVYNKWQLTKGIGEGEDTTKGSLAHKGRWARARPHVLRKAPGAEAASRGVAGRQGLRGGLSAARCTTKQCGGRVPADRRESAAWPAKGPTMKNMSTVISHCHVGMWSQGPMSLHMESWIGTTPMQ